jgi:hypothetical protein
MCPFVNPFFSAGQFRRASRGNNRDLAGSQSSHHQPSGVGIKEQSICTWNS